MLNAIKNECKENYVEGVEKKGEDEQSDNLIDMGLWPKPLAYAMIISLSISVASGFVNLAYFINKLLSL